MMARRISAKKPASITTLSSVKMNPSVLRR